MTDTEKMLRKKLRLEEATKDPKAVSIAKKSINELLNDDEYIQDILAMPIDDEVSEAAADLAMSYVRKLKAYLRTL